MVAALYPVSMASGQSSNPSGNQTSGSATNASGNQSAQAPTQLKSGTFDGLLAIGTITKADLVGPLQGENISDLVNITKSGNAYVNVHTTQRPAGEIRGDLNDNSWWTDSNFVALNASQELAATQPSSASLGNQTAGNQSVGNITSSNITATTTTSSATDEAMGVALFQRVNQSEGAPMTSNQSGGNATSANQSASSNQSANFKVH